MRHTKKVFEFPLCSGYTNRESRYLRTYRLIKQRWGKDCMGKLTALLEPKEGIAEDRKKFSNADLKSLILPIIIEQFLVLLVGIADTLMISYAGEAAVSGVSLVDQLNTLFNMVFTALASGGAVVASQYIGKREGENAGLAAGQLLLAGGFLSLVIMVTVLLCKRWIFGILFGKVEADVLAGGLMYLRISAYSYPFLAIYHACAGLFRSMERTKSLMYVSLAMNTINVIGNAVGIFILHAGVAGVAYPSLFSRAFAAVVLLCLLCGEKSPIRLKVRQVFSWRPAMLVRIFRIGIPGGVENGLFQLSKVALSSIVALFGTTQIAANGVAQSFWSMAALFCTAMGNAFITVIGQYMGAGDPQGADYYMRKLLRITYLGAVCWNFLFYLLTPFILKFYDLTPEAVRLVMQLVLIHNIFNALFCPVSLGFTNGLRAAGDVKFTLCASIFSTVICRVALSVLFGIVFHLGVIGIAWAMVCDWGIKAVLILGRWKTGKWKTCRVI